jgi:MinD superfamily P-loop ATPase
MIKSNYYARIDQDVCIQCGVCADERCQVGAVEVKDDVYRVIEKQCIGCGLCVTTCPTEAITLVAKATAERELPPQNEDQWFEKRAQSRGVDYSQFVK